MPDEEYLGDHQAGHMLFSKRKALEASAQALIVQTLIEIIGESPNNIKMGGPQVTWLFPHEYETNLRPEVTRTPEHLRQEGQPYHIFQVMVWLRPYGFKHERHGSNLAVGQPLFFDAETCTWGLNKYDSQHVTTAAEPQGVGAAIAETFRKLTSPTATHCLEAIVYHDRRGRAPVCQSCPLQLACLTRSEVPPP